MAEPTDPTLPCSWCQLVLFIGALIPSLTSGNWNAILTDLFQPTWPFNLLFPNFYTLIFGGRPKVGPDSATDNTARVLMQSKNPVVRLWGAGVRAQEARGEILSSSDPRVQHQLGELRNRAYRDLVTQFGSQLGAQMYQHYVNTAYSRMCNESGGPERPACITAMRHGDQISWFYFVQQGWLDPKTGKPTSSNPYSAACACAGG